MLNHSISSQDCLIEQGDAANTPDMEADGVSIPTSLRTYDIMFALASNKIKQALKHQPWRDEGTIKLLGQATELLDKFSPEEGDPETWRYLFMRGIVAYSNYCQNQSAPNLEIASEECRKACVVRQPRHCKPAQAHFLSFLFIER
jgi:hypothetical protein